VAESLFKHTFSKSQVEIDKQIDRDMECIGMGLSDSSGTMPIQLVYVGSHIDFWWEDKPVPSLPVGHCTTKRVNPQEHVGDLSLGPPITWLMRDEDEVTFFFKGDEIRGSSSYAVLGVAPGDEIQFGVRSDLEALEVWEEYVQTGGLMHPDNGRLQ
jgi:hypothetical protein